MTETVNYNQIGDVIYSKGDYSDLVKDNVCYGKNRSSS